MNAAIRSPRYRQPGLLLILAGWLCCQHYRPDSWLQTVPYGIVAWQLVSSGVWLAGCAILLAKSRATQCWAPALRLVLLLVMAAVLGMGVYYTYQGQQAEAKLARWHQQRTGLRPAPTPQ